jgi:hypothetical protein
MLIAVYADILEANALAMAGDLTAMSRSNPSLAFRGGRTCSRLQKRVTTGTICLRKKVPWPHRLSWLAGLGFRGLGRGKFSISVGLGARGTCVQFTSLSDRCATGVTGHG